MQYKSIADHALLSRWLAIISEFSIECQWRAGAQHRNADGLSRATFHRRKRPCLREDCPECTQGQPERATKVTGEAEESRSTLKCPSPDEESSSSGCDVDSDDNQPTFTMPSEPPPKVNLPEADDGQAGNLEHISVSTSPPSEEGGGSGTDEDSPPELIAISNWAEQYSVSDLSKFQNEDTDLKLVKDWLKENLEKPPSKDALLVESSTVKALAAQFNLLTIQDEVMYRIIPDKQMPESLEITQYVVPYSMREKLLTQIHNHCGHWGYEKCSHHLKSKHYWPGMSTDLKDFIASCVHCGRTKGNKRRYVKLQPYPSGIFNERIHIDIWKGSVPGKMPIVGAEDGSYLEYNYVLGVIDSHTKLVRFINMKSKSAEECADSILRDWILLYGFPVKIMSDQDKAFLSALFSQLCAATGVQQVSTTTFHPQANGQAEICFRQLGRFIKIMIASELEDWPLMTRFCEFHVNSSVSTAHGVSPFQMVYGMHARTASELQWSPSPRIKIPRVACNAGYVLWLQKQIRQVQHYARQNLKLSAARMKRQYDRHSVKLPKLGQYCYRYKPPWNKFQCKFIGPGKIIKILSEVHILWQEAPSSPVIRVNLKNIKAYTSTRTPANWLTPSTEVMEATRVRQPSPDLINLDTDSQDDNQPDQPGSDQSSQDNSSSSEEEVEVARRSTRTRRPVNKLDL